MKVGDLVKHLYSEHGMTGVIVEIVSWKHTESKTPSVLWDDGSIAKIPWGLIEAVNESR
ncbi:hypothetical protein OAA09_01390 [bacterium]|nr:hypothetical protein [bacterium]